MDERLQIMVGQEMVEGRFVFLFFNDMQVEITSPFQGVSEGRHIPYFGLPFGRYEQNGTLTQKGQETAHDLLREIYDACLFCEANADELLQECRGLLDLGGLGLAQQAAQPQDFVGRLASQSGGFASVTPDEMGDGEFLSEYPRQEVRPVVARRPGSRAAGLLRVRATGNPSAGMKASIVTALACFLSGATSKRKLSHLEHVYQPSGYNCGSAHLKMQADRRIDLGDDGHRVDADEGEGVEPGEHARASLGGMVSLPFYPNDTRASTIRRKLSAPAEFTRNNLFARSGRFPRMPTG